MIKSLYSGPPSILVTNIVITTPFRCLLPHLKFFFYKLSTYSMQTKQNGFISIVHKWDAKNTSATEWNVQQEIFSFTFFIMKEKTQKNYMNMRWHTHINTLEFRSQSWLTFDAPNSGSKPSWQRTISKKNFEKSSLHSSIVSELETQTSMITFLTALEIVNYDLTVFQTYWKLILSKTATITTIETDDWFIFQARFCWEGSCEEQIWIRREIIVGAFSQTIYMANHLNRS